MPSSSDSLARINKDCSGNWQLCGEARQLQQSVQKLHMNKADGCGESVFSPLLEALGDFECLLERLPYAQFNRSHLEHIFTSLS